MIKFLCAVVAGAFLALMINVYMQSNKLTEATVKAVEQKQTVKPSADYEISRVKVIKDNSRRFFCYYDTYRGVVINCTLM